MGFLLCFSSMSKHCTIFCTRVSNLFIDLFYHLKINIFNYNFLHYKTIKLFYKQVLGKQKLNISFQWCHALFIFQPTITIVHTTKIYIFMEDITKWYCGQTFTFSNCLGDTQRIFVFVHRPHMSLQAEVVHSNFILHFGGPKRDYFSPRN